MKSFSIVSLTLASNLEILIKLFNQCHVNLRHPAGICCADGISVEPTFIINNHFILLRHEFMVVVHILEQKHGSKHES